MRINNNMLAMNTHRQMGISGGNQAKSMEKLSSGLKINRAGDDAAGLAISEKMRGQIRGLNMASKNSQDGISLIQTAEGALNETQSILQRMRELAVQSSNDTNVAVDRGEIQKEMNQLTSEINRIGNTTEFNTMKLVNGDRADSIQVAKATAKTYGVPTKGLTVATGAVKLSTTGITIGTTLSAGGSSLAIADAVSATVEIFKNTAGNLSIKIFAAASGAAIGSAGVINVSDTETLSFSGGKATYNEHGVSFTISQSDWENATVGKSVKLDLRVNLGGTGTNALNSGDGSYSTDTSVTFAGKGNLTTSGIVIGSDSQFNVAKIEVAGSGAGKNFTVTLKDINGNILVTDTIEQESGATEFAYDNHGISFEVENLGSAAQSGVTFSVNLEMGTGEKVTNNGLSFQVGANENQSMGLSISDMRSEALGIATTTANKAGFTASKGVTDGTSNANAEYSLDVSTHTKAASAITTLNNAIEKVSGERSKLGAVQNRLEYTIKNLDTSAENLQAAESRIRDVDMAKEMVNLSKQNILQQASQAMMAQANQATQGVLQLLR